jgi:6-phosphogluconolactonase/glucosamine-6-phosphate isomerase/deaminase
MQIQEYQNPEEARMRCAKAITERIKSIITRPVVLFLSGGSSVSLIPEFETAWKEFGENIRNITVAMVDERLDPVASNFVELKQKYPSFISFLLDNGATVIDTTPRFASQYEAADWYDTTVKEIITKTKEQNGSVFALLGMGIDGHTAGILPYPVSEEKEFYPLFFDTDRFVVGVDASGKNQYAKRYTLTYPALLKADELFVFATGEQKKPVIDTLKTATDPLHSCPALFFAYTKQPVTIFLDL